MIIECSCCLSACMAWLQTNVCSAHVVHLRLTLCHCVRRLAIRESQYIVALRFGTNLEAVASGQTCINSQSISQSPRDVTNVEAS